jgi:hypothetical protein
MSCRTSTRHSRRQEHSFGSRTRETGSSLAGTLARGTDIAVCALLPVLALLATLLP